MSIRVFWFLHKVSEIPETNSLLLFYLAYCLLKNNEDLMEIALNLLVGLLYILFYLSKWFCLQDEHHIPRDEHFAR